MGGGGLRYSLLVAGVNKGNFATLGGWQTFLSNNPNLYAGLSWTLVDNLSNGAVVASGTFGTGTGSGGGGGSGAPFLLEVYDFNGTTIFKQTFHTANLANAYVASKYTLLALGSLGATGSFAIYDNAVNMMASGYIAPLPTVTSVYGPDGGLVAPSDVIAASGIPPDALLQLKQLNVPVPVIGPLGPAFTPNPNSIGGNDAFLAGVPGAIGTVKNPDGSYTQYANPTNPPKGTILGTSTIPATLSASGTIERYNIVADGQGGSYNVGPL